MADLLKQIQQVRQRFLAEPEFYQKLAYLHDLHRLQKLLKQLLENKTLG